MKTEDKNSDRYIPTTTASDGHTEASLRKMVIELRKQLQQERNKAIDACVELLLDQLEDESNTREELRECSDTVIAMEKLKV